MQSRKLGEALLARGYTIATMESCTAGLIGSYITDISGSSAYMRGGIISYATDIKILHNVSTETIHTFGVISNETAKEMAIAVRESITSTIGIGITGVAGPNSQDNKPVGEVHIAVANADTCLVKEYHFSGDRIEIKKQAAKAAIELAITFLSLY